ncbi:DciA family protein [Treponema pectinovorum]|uniref:DciA family protein n=1 Tax=Treponema pectinovorum TaxID=164 RepID=UPI003D93245D
MKENDIMNASEMITRIFKNISPSQIEQGNKIVNLWREIVESIKSNSINGENIGKNMASHSKVVDLKNGILLVEADHPGWIQMLGNYKKYILRGFEMKIPELKINSLAFRLAGTNAELLKVNSKINEQKERLNEEKKIEKEQKVLENSGFAYKSYQEKKEENKLPPELQKMFDDMKKDMLTNI